MRTTILKKNNTKWKRDEKKNAEITIIEDIYTLTVTQYKNKPIYKDGLLISNEPYVLKYNKLTDENELVE